MSESSKGQGKVQAQAAAARGSRRFRGLLSHYHRLLAQAERPLAADLPPSTLDEAWSDNFVAKFSPRSSRAANFEVKFAGLSPGLVSGCCFELQGVSNQAGDDSRLAFITTGGGD